MAYDKISNMENNEVGYNYLNTAFTGTTAPELSGASDFFFYCNDRGVARTLKDFEL